MAVNKVVYVENGVQKTLVDLTADTVAADKLASGITAHDKTGAQITGTMETSSVKLQPSKSVTVTQNGTISVSPDSGYDGLKKADITVNVPSSGGTDLKTMIIEFEVINNDGDICVAYINKHEEDKFDCFSDFSSSNIVEIETVDPGYIVIQTLEPFTYGNIEYDAFGNQGTWIDESNGNTHIGIISTEYLHSMDTNRVVLDFS